AHLARYPQSTRVGLRDETRIRGSNHASGAALHLHEFHRTPDHAAAVRPAMPPLAEKGRPMKLARPIFSLAFVLVSSSVVAAPPEPARPVTLKRGIVVTKATEPE